MHIARIVTLRSTILSIMVIPLQALTYILYYCYTNVHMQAVPGWSVAMFARQCLPASAVFLSYTKLGAKPQSLFLVQIVANQQRDGTSEDAVGSAKTAIEEFLSQNYTGDINTLVFDEMSFYLCFCYG